MNYDRSVRNDIEADRRRIHKQVLAVQYNDINNYIFSNVKEKTSFFFKNETKK